jgi:hypothetical protein
MNRPLRIHSMKTCRPPSLKAQLLFLCTFLFACAVQGQPVMNIEICYMIKFGAGAHSHLPSASERAAVIQMFACHGITLNIQVTNPIFEIDVMPRDPNSPNIFFDYDNGSTSFAYLKQTYFIHANDPGWHHCIFGHQYANTDGSASTSSGLGEEPGDDFVVTLGSFADQIGTPWDRAATLAHEFGHNLGLEHGTAQAFQPNKPSIMSYFYQLSGVQTKLIAAGLSTSVTSLFKEMDYSQGTMCTLNESALDETIGTRMASVDWDCDAAIGGIVTNTIDGAASWCPVNVTIRRALVDVNEWLVLHDPTMSQRPEELTNMPVSVGITSEEARVAAAAIPYGQPAPVIENCVQPRMIYVESANYPSPNGDCKAPYNTPGQAQSQIPDGSNLFLFPGTYHEGGPVTYTKPMTIFSNVGAATIAP